MCIYIYIHICTYTIASPHILTPHTWSQSYVSLSPSKAGMGKPRHLGVHDASCHSRPLDSLLTKICDRPKKRLLAMNYQGTGDSMGV